MFFDRTDHSRGRAKEPRWREDRRAPEVHPDTLYALISSFLNVLLLILLASAPQPLPEALKRDLQEDTENWNDWSESFYVTVAIKDAEGEKAGSVALYIIIGVITAVALIITVVLIVSLNKKRDDDYMPVDDLEDDRLLTDTY